MVEKILRQTDDFKAAMESTFIPNLSLQQYLQSLVVVDNDLRYFTSNLLTK